MWHLRVILVLLPMAAGVVSGAPARAANLDVAAAERFARLALDCVHREYPNKIAHVMTSDEDARAPRELTPVFWGCFDWHSSVHGHWLLSRLARRFPEAGFAADARRALATSFTADRVAGEVAYLSHDERASFERPYGLAWLLQLVAELHEWDDPQAREWRETLRPLEELAARRVLDWVPKLAYPIRTGEHSQTAFAFGLMLDWARAVERGDVERLLVDATGRLYLDDAGCPLGYEPSGQDFLSPCLAEADLVRRVLTPPELAAWLGAFLPEIPLRGGADWLPVAVVTDRTDGKLAHLDGVNLSRAWMLEGIATGLPGDDPRQAALLAAAAAHRESALPNVTAEHYEGSHWLGSFAAYLVTGRGMSR